MYSLDEALSEMTYSKLGLVFLSGSQFN